MDCPPSLAVYLPSLHAGGAERATVNLTAGLVGTGVEVDLVLGEAAGPLLGEVDSRVRVVDLGAPRSRHAVGPLRRYLEDRSPDTVLSVMHHASVAAHRAHRSARSTARLVMSERIHLSAVLGEYSPGYRWALLRMLRRAYRAADAVICVSAGVAEDLVDHGMRRDRLVVAFNPTITPDLLDRAHRPVEHPWFAAGDTPVIVSAGRLEAQKDYPTLLAAFARLTVPARLVILGEGSERPRLEALAGELGVADRVSMPGLVDHPASYVARSAVFVLPSAFEGLPNALIEALPLGVPVVSTDCPSGPDEILAGGRYGALVPVGDATAMAGAVQRALRGEIEPPPEEAWAPFTVGAATARYSEILFPTGSDERD